jgi:hypothetical protein
MSQKIKQNQRKRKKKNKKKSHPTIPGMVGGGDKGE